MPASDSPPTCSWQPPTASAAPARSTAPSSWATTSWRRGCRRRMMSCEFPIAPGWGSRWTKRKCAGWRSTLHANAGSDKNEDGSAPRRRTGPGLCRRDLRRYAAEGPMTVPTRQVALLRGINVGRNKRVAMADLRRLLQELGYVDVITHLNSGNAVFTSPLDPSASAEGIEQALVRELGVAAKVVVRTHAELAA